MVVSDLRPKAPAMTVSTGDTRDPGKDPGELSRRGHDEQLAALNAHDTAGFAAFYAEVPWPRSPPPSAPGWSVS
jgi:hypothetical protein